MQQNHTISIDKMSPKLLVGECLDMAKIVLQELIQVYCSNHGYEFPIPNNSNDLLGFINYMLEPARYEKITETFVINKKNANASNFIKSFLKSWLHQLKTVRNAFAHWSTFDFDLRMAGRAFDTLSLIYNAFNGDPNYEVFVKIEYYRKVIVEYSVAMNGAMSQH